MSKHASTAPASLSQEAIAGVLSLMIADPHRVLGAHPVDGGVSVRAYFPDADRVQVIPDGQAGIEMTRRHPAGFFEALVPGATMPLGYTLSVHYPTGDSYTKRDPYAFLPTLGDVDLHLFSEGRHERIYDKLGAHVREIDGVSGLSFAVWVPNAKSVSVVGDFNSWDGRLHPMRAMGGGVWELFVPDLQPGVYYKYEIRTAGGGRQLRADPYGRATEVPPGTASRAFESNYQFRDATWLAQRLKQNWRRQPVSIYECHLGSWRRMPEEGNRSLTYREIAPQLADYLTEMGFTHVEFLPLTEHPYYGSWGYQVSGFYAPTARYGSPDDFKYLIDHLHERGIGVILDWVPGHFPKDRFALARFDGTPVYEHADPRQGEHPEWGTLIFNYGRHEVRNFLMANARFWLDEYHLDGLRVDAVASMIHLDYGREPGQWIPNVYGGRENLDAVAFLQEVNGVVHAHHPGALTIAEESTAWPGVSHPTETGGLGFDFKWNMGWMNDTLAYFKEDPIHRRHHHGKLTFGLMYAWSENFILPLSHDEVVHMKGSLVDKMPGDRWQKMANLRALFGYMWAHPGKKMLFMGGEIAQWREWNHDSSIDWHLLAEADHQGMQTLVKDLNHLYRQYPALWAADDRPEGFRWLDADNADENVVAFYRLDPATGEHLICLGNFSPIVRDGYRVGLPEAGTWREVLNTDATVYGGSNVGNQGAIIAEELSAQGQPYSAPVVLPPLGVLWLRHDPTSRKKPTPASKKATKKPAAGKSAKAAPSRARGRRKQTTN